MVLIMPAPRRAAGHEGLPLAHPGLPPTRIEIGIAILLKFHHPPKPNPPQFKQIIIRRRRRTYFYIYIYIYIHI